MHIGTQPFQQRLKVALGNAGQNGRILRPGGGKQLRGRHGAQCVSWKIPYSTGRPVDVLHATVAVVGDIDPQQGLHAVIPGMRQIVDRQIVAQHRLLQPVAQHHMRRIGHFIGVDADQYAEAPGHILTSMVKGVDVAVFEATRWTKDGTFKGGIYSFGLKEGGVGYIYDDRNRALIPDGVHTRVEELKQEIIAGRIKVPSTR